MNVSAGVTSAVSTQVRRSLSWRESMRRLLLLLEELVLTAYPFTGFGAT